MSAELFALGSALVGTVVAYHLGERLWYVVLHCRVLQATEGHERDPSNAALDEAARLATGRELAAAKRFLRRAPWLGGLFAAGLVVALVGLATR